MKILIVEDTAKKAKVMRSWVEECASAAADNVQVFQTCNAHDAYHLIESESPGLVILDILIPLLKDGKSTEDSSVWLVKEIQRRIEKESRPLVIGVTQFPDSKKLVEASFGKYLWQVLVFSPHDNEWKKWIKYGIDYVGSGVKYVDFFSGASFADAVIVTALRSPEFSSVVEAFGGGERLDVRITGENWVQCRISDHNGDERKIVIACAEEMGMSAMSSLVTRVCIATKPKYLFLAGIMGGNADLVGLADLVAIDETWDCRAGKLTDEGLAADVKSLPGSSFLRNIAIGEFNQKFMLSLVTDWPDKDINIIPSFRHGAVACSPAVLAYDGAFEELAEQKRKVFGVEMEAFGCYFAASQLGEFSPKVICFKSVCDLGDKKKSDKLQKFAAYISARSIHHLVSSAAIWK